MIEERQNTLVTIERVDEASIKIFLSLGTVIATSFYKSRMNQLYEELSNGNEREVKDMMLHWYQSKLINFWAEFDLEKYLNV